jgi:hypothetical protein
VSNLVLINKESLIGAPCISIKQPWAWAILNASKDIENRDWSTKFRGRILIHAGKKPELDDFPFVKQNCDNPLAIHNWYKFITDQPLGAIVGSVTITNCVEHSSSKWFFGRYGFVLSEPRSFIPVPYKGQLGIFKITKEGLGL